MADTMFDRLRKAIAAEEPIALATVVESSAPASTDSESTASEGAESTADDGNDVPSAGGKLLITPGGEPEGSLGNEELDRVVLRDAIGELSAGTSGIRHYGPRGEARQEDVSVFIESFAPPPQMLIFGAVDFTAALSRVAKILGYRVTVCDARPVFATTQRFPYADEVVVDWPNRFLDKVGADLGPRDAICVLTHDPKFDVPAVTSALTTKAGYLGAMGSRRTTEDRNDRLRAEGITDAQLDTIMAPIGLDLGARTPEETAISICAEIIALRSDRRPPSLRDTSGDIHS
ncbi:MAG: XdhC family protein [Acidimicrobiales bacterium]